MKGNQTTKANCCICGKEYLFTETDYSDYLGGFVCMDCQNTVDTADYYAGEEYDNDEWRNR